MTRNTRSPRGLALVLTVCLLTAPLAVFLYMVPLDVTGDPPFSDNELVNVVNSESQTAPSIAVDNTGNIYVAWEDLRSTSNWDIYFANSTDGGTTWSSPNVIVNSDGTITDQNNPVIAVDDAGKLFAVWENDTTGEADICISNSTDGGATWSSPHVMINTDGLSSVPQYGPAIAVNSTDEVYVVWYDARSGSDWDIYFSKSTDGGATWMDPNIMVNNASVSTDQQLPTIAVDDNGVIYVAWEDDRDGNSNIYFAKSTDSGSTWSDPNIKVNTNVSANHNPSITVDDSGNIYLAWQDNRKGNYDIYYAMSSDGGVTWSDPNEKVNNDVGTENQEEPSITVNSTGAIFVAWEDFRWSDYDVYFAISEDMGATWSYPNLRVNDDTSSTHQQAPSLTAGPDGSAYIAWQDYRSTDNFDIYFAFLQSSAPPPTVDYIDITNIPGGTPLAGGPVSTNFTEWGNCSLYNNTSGYIGTVSANWTVQGGSATRLGPTPAVKNGINVGTTAATVWLNATYNGFSDSVEYSVSELLVVDSIAITRGPGGTPLAGGNVPVGFSEGGNCSAYNNTSGFIGVVNASWSVDGDTAALLFPTPGLYNGINVGTAAGDVWLNASYDGHTASVHYIVSPAEVDYIEITSTPGGTQLVGGTVVANTVVWGNCSIYNNTAGYMDLVNANWTVDGGSATLLGANPSVMNGIDVGGTEGDVWFNVSFDGYTDSVLFTVSWFTIDYVLITDVPNGTHLTGGAVTIGFRKWGNCSAYNVSGGYIGLVGADWSAEGGDASLIGLIQALQSGIDVGTTPGTVWFNATYGGFSDSIQYIVSHPSVDYIEITDVPDGNPLIGGVVPVGFREWGNCSLYNITLGYLGVGSADWTAEGGSSSLTDAVTGTFNGIDVGIIGGTVWFNASYEGFNHSIQYTVIAPTVDYIVIRTSANGEGEILDTETFAVNGTATYYAAGYNITFGFVHDIPDAEWAVTGGIGSVSSPGAFTTFTASSDAGTGTITVKWGGITNQSGMITVEGGVDITPPSAPGKPSLKVKGKDSIEISWPANTETDLGGYRIYRRTSPDDDWTLVGTVDETTTSFTDTDLKSGTKYYYSVTAIDDAATPNESPYSQVASGTTEKNGDSSFLIMLLLIIIIVIIVVVLLLVLTKKKPAEEQPPAHKDEEAKGPVEEEAGVEEDLEVEGGSEYADSGDVEEVE